MIKLMFLCLLLFSCSNYSLIKYPSKDLYKQDRLFCWQKQNNEWKVIGPRQTCPENTYYEY